MMYINVCVQATIDSFMGNTHTMVGIMVDVKVTSVKHSIKHMYQTRVTLILIILNVFLPKYN